MKKSMDGAYACANQQDFAENPISRRSAKRRFSADRNQQEVGGVCEQSESTLPL